jgi:hypothetical protein
MDRPRFQVDIGTMMVIIAAIAVPLAIARSFGAMWAVISLTPATRLLFYAYVRGRCRSEGRPMSGVDRAKVHALDIRVGTPVFVAASILLYCCFSAVPH